jgi:hypothetical protein
MKVKLYFYGRLENETESRLIKSHFPESSEHLHDLISHFIFMVEREYLAQLTNDPRPMISFDRVEIVVERDDTPAPA